MTDVTLWRMRSPSDGGELVCLTQLDASGVWRIALVFRGIELESVARETRSVVSVVRFADETGRSLLEGGWCETDDERLSDRQD